MMTKIALSIEYDGTRFCGWQRQPGQLTVQGEVERALSLVAECSIEVHCAGRTDAGVHAAAQVVHFETAVVRPDKAWVLGANTHLPADIRIHWAKQVDADFHARFSATARRYRYQIYNAPTASAIRRHETTWIPQPLAVELMHEAAQYCLGEQDFTSFRAQECQSKTPFRCVHEVGITRVDNIITLDIKANAFLHHMVRNIMGTLILIGERKHPPHWLKTVLEAKDRTQAGPTAPPQGLCLIEVDYQMTCLEPGSRKVR